MTNKHKQRQVNRTGDIFDLSLSRKIYEFFEGYLIWISTYFARGVQNQEYFAMEHEIFKYQMGSYVDESVVGFFKYNVL